MAVEFEERTGTRRAEAPGDAGDGRGAASSRAAGALHGGRLLVAALWLGGAAFFSFAVAPSAFAVLPTRDLAGALVARTLAVVNVGGALAGLLLLATLPFGRARVGRFALRAEAAALAVVAASSAAGHWLIAARMRALRAQMAAPIDSLAPADPLRVAFNDLHGYSVAALLAGMLAGVVALLLIARRGAKPSSQ
ncbi:MAG TPA: DUF4149 domain-containing protein [Pyrinomonadaceae bacterium]|nr:DUF4149 domain-containing protein [Pyrinomonadaceae bacterium]